MPGGGDFAFRADCFGTLARRVLFRERIIVSRADKRQTRRGVEYTCVIYTIPVQSLKYFDGSESIKSDCCRRRVNSHVFLASNCSHASVRVSASAVSITPDDKIAGSRMLDREAGMANAGYRDARIDTSYLQVRQTIYHAGCSDFNGSLTDIPSRNLYRYSQSIIVQ